jgi:gas vesicle protein
MKHQPEVIKMKKSNWLAGLIIGGMAGAVTTLLTTPSSGKDLKKNLRKTKDFMKETAKEVISNTDYLKQTVSQFLHEGKTVIPQTSKELKESIKLWQENIQSNKNAIEEGVHHIQVSVKNLEKTTKRKDKR